MKILLSFCTILLVMSNILFSQTHISGALEGTLPSGTYIVDDVIYVLQSDSLIIDPGVTLLFNGNFEFNVNGYLYAVGTHYDSIKFIHNIPDSTWGGIDFNDFTNINVPESIEIKFDINATKTLKE